MFGPMLALLALYVGSSTASDSWITYDPDKVWVAKYLLPVARSIHQANIITGFSVLLATSVRAAGDLLPVSESRFLSALALYEFLTCCICTLSYLPLHTSSSLEKSALAIYVVAVLFLWIVSSSISSGKVLETIASSCASQPVDSILRFVPPSANNHKGILDFDDNVLGWILRLTSPFWLIPVMVIALFLVYIICLSIILIGLSLATLVVSVTHVPYELLAGLLHVGPRRLGTLLIILSLGSASTASVWWLLARLLSLRDQIHALAGDRYQDNDWGFGQVTAVMTWVPVVQEISFAMIREYLPPLSHSLFLQAQRVLFLERFLLSRRIKLSESEC